MSSIFGMVGALVDTWFGSREPRRRDERGLSQSTENAILLAGAVAVAALVIAVITVFVESRLPK